MKKGVNALNDLFLLLCSLLRVGVDFFQDLLVTVRSQVAKDSSVCSPEARAR